MSEHERIGRLIEAIDAHVSTTLPQGWWTIARNQVRGGWRVSWGTMWDGYHDTTGYLSTLLAALTEAAERLGIEVGG